MNQYTQFVIDHQLAIYAGFSAVVSMLPPPRDDERWYTFVYNLAHFGAMNIAKVFPALRVERKNGA
jgi:hypothetical protein